MPFSITTQDGITINNIPDNIAPDAQVLRQRVAEIRATRAQQPSGAVAPAVAPAAGISPRARAGRVAPVSEERILGEREAELAALSPERRELIESISPLEAGLIGAGRGLTGIARGLGLAEPEDPATSLAIEQLRAQQPALTVGEVAGEAAPFLIPGAAAGAIPRLGARALATGAVGAGEAAIIARGRDATTGQQAAAAGIGGAIAGGFELAVPIIGRLGGSLIRRLTGRPPKGAVIDAAGNPSDELVDALNKSGQTIDDLTAQAQRELQGQAVDPEQVARQARAEAAGVPLTRGELTQRFEEQATEQQLLQSAADPQAEKFRQFKLTQSEAIRKKLEGSVDTKVLPEESGTLIKDALTGQKKLLRTQKNELYAEAAENSKNLKGLPLFTDSVEDAIPDADTLEDLAITAPEALSKLDNLLVKFGLKEPAEGVTVDTVQLSVSNAERFRKNLNAIQRGDQTGASSVAIGGIKDALDGELDNLADVLTKQGVPDNIVAPLKKARKTVRQLKTEFSPQALVGQLVDVKRDGITPIIESSKVYSKLSSSAQPVENVRKLVKTLNASGEQGVEALAGLQTTALLDLIDAGFGTGSRKIDGVRVFSPTAFKKRVKSIGRSKLKAIFENNPEMLANIRNIDELSADLIPAAGAVPKGSAPVLQDLMNRLGIITISAKIPGGNLVVEQLQRLSQGAQTRRAVERAVTATPEAIKADEVIRRQFPGLTSALGVTAAAVGVSQTQQQQ